MIFPQFPAVEDVYETVFAGAGFDVSSVRNLEAYYVGLWVECRGGFAGGEVEVNNSNDAEHAVKQPQSDGGPNIRIVVLLKDVQVAAK